MESGKRIWYLIKFFSKREHAEMFMDGNLHMNRLSYFKPLETSSGDGRGDPYEAVSHWWQPHDTIIKLNFQGFPELTITKEDLGSTYLDGVRISRLSSCLLHVRDGHDGLRVR